MAVPSPWITPRLLRLRRALALGAVVDACLAFGALALLVAPGRAGLLFVSAVEGLGLTASLETPPKLTLLVLALAGAGAAFGLAAWANPRRHALASRRFGDAHLLVALVAAAALLGDPDDLGSWTLLLAGSLVSTALRLRWRPAALPLLRERDAELRRDRGWTFDRAAGSSSMLLDVVLARGLGPDPQDLVDLEYRLLRLHPLASLLGRARGVVGFFDAPGNPWVEGYRLPTEQGELTAPWRSATGPRRGFFVLRSAGPASRLPHALVLDGPASRRNVEGDPRAAVQLRVVMPRSGDPTLLLGRASLRLGPLHLPAGHVVLKAWRRHRYAGEEPPR